MAKTPDPFFNFDVTKIMGEFDPTKMADEFAKIAAKYKMPGVDMSAIVDSQRKNLEALTAANRVAMEGVQAVAKRQAEILQETMDEVSTVLDKVTKAGSPTDAASTQAEFAKTAFEKALSNMRELAEMVAKSNNEATQAINTRISETLDEIKDMAMKMK